KGPAMVDGLPWPVREAGIVWLPAGSHVVEASRSNPPLHVVQLNGDLKSARVVNASTIEVAYRSAARAIGLLDRPVTRIQVDGVESPLVMAGPNALFLPKGQHLVTLSIETGAGGLR